jgi:hypothetical protein
MQQAMLRRTHCGPAELVWVGAGFLLWWPENTPAPGPLLTTGPPGAGALLGQPTTRTLFGNDRTNFGSTPGVWVEAGTWLDQCHQWGVGLAGFILERQAQGAAFSSDPTGNPVLARPFTNPVETLGPGPASFPVSTPGTFAGSVAVSQNLQFAGWELNLLRDLEHRPGWDFQVLAGFRYLDLYENLNISQSRQFLQDVFLGPPGGTVLPAGTLQTIADRFTTRNQAYLGQVGAQLEWSRGPLFVDLMGKVGLGPNHERVRMLGSTTTLAPGASPTVFPGGLLAVPGTPLLPGGNFGTHTTNWFVIVPEVGATVGVDIGTHLRLSAGYSFLYVNSVARPGSQVNRIVNPNLVPGTATFGLSPSGPGQPQVLTKQDDFWVHGLRFMAVFRF